ncbi:MAG: DUF349 domain-containing protein [Candidatus Nanopelagicales bacterium]|nr:DUF349 domain-containing protein [Candidatus Nanopelagicales bacterium]
MIEHEHGRVADDGTVYVRRPDGTEVAVGQWAAGDPAAGLAFFERKYDGLKVEAELLLTRLKDGKGSPESVAVVTAKLREQLETPHVVGDLAALGGLAEQLEAAGEARRVQAAAAKEAAREQVLAARRAIAEEAEQLATSTQWKATGERFKELQTQWSALPRGEKATRDVEQELWKRFSSARSGFDRARRAHFAQLDATRKEATAAKEAIIARAEALSSSTEWNETTRAYRGLMDEWKAAPRAGRTDEDKLWARFRAAQDAFFAARNAVAAERDEDQRANLTAKEALAAEAEALLPIRDLAAARAALRGIGERWNAIGHVPLADRDRVEGRLRRVEDAVHRFEADQWRRTDPAKRALAESTVQTFRDSLAKLETQAAAAQAAGNAAKAADLQGRITQTQALLAAAESSLAEYSAG